MEYHDNQPLLNDQDDMNEVSQNLIFSFKGI